MRLLDLDPRWYEGRTFIDGQWAYPRAGLTFLCPHCQECRLAVPVHSDGANMDPEPGEPRTFGAGEFVWSMAGEGFNDMSLTPSVDASKSGHWHGFITNGEIV